MTETRNLTVRLGAVPFIAAPGELVVQGSPQRPLLALSVLVQVDLILTELRIGQDIVGVAPQSKATRSDPFDDDTGERVLFVQYALDCATIVRPGENIMAMCHVEESTSFRGLYVVGCTFDYGYGERLRVGVNGC
jgi:hypothetical protein